MGEIHIFIHLNSYSIFKRICHIISCNCSCKLLYNFLVARFSRLSQRNIILKNPLQYMSFNFNDKPG